MRNLKILIFSLFITFMFNLTVFAAPYINLTLSYGGKIHTYNAEEVYLFVNSEKINDLTMPPIILNGYTLVPIREIFEPLGASVEWIKDTEEIEIIYKNNNLKIKVGNKNTILNNNNFEMLIEPKLINSKTMIPVRFVSEALGLNVEWKGDTREINISEKIVIESNLNGNLESIKMPDSDERTFEIYADKKIEKYEVNKIEDNLIALDIYNFNNKIKDSTLQSVTDVVSNVNIEQKEGDVTRFTFKTLKDLNHNVFLSEDGKTIFVNFGGSQIKKIELINENETSDILKIYFEYIPDLSIEKIDNKIIIKLKNSSIINLSENIQEGNYVSSVRYTQNNEENTTQNIDIELEINKDVNFKKEVNNNILIIKIGENLPAEDKPNISLDRQFIIDKKDEIKVDLTSILHNDDYLNKAYTLKFGQDISNLISIGEYKINNELVDKIIVENIEDKTELIIKSNNIIAVDITEDNSKIYINILRPKEKYKNIIVIDPGHGGKDPGTIGNGLVEKEITLDISLKLLKLFENDKDIKLYFTRTSDVYPTFDDRTNMANEVGDMFISIHINAADKNPKASGSEVYYLNPNTSDTGLNSKAIADILQSKLISLGTKDRGVRKSNFKVLRDSNIPSVLCEIAFVTNDEDAKKLSSESFRQDVARVLYEGCKELMLNYSSKK